MVVVLLGGAAALTWLAARVHDQVRALTAALDALATLVPADAELAEEIAATRDRRTGRHGAGDRHAGRSGS